MERKKLLTSKGKLLAILGLNNGTVKFNEARKFVGTQIYAAVRQGVLEGWLIDKKTELVLKDKEMLELGKCLAECIFKQ